MDENLDFSEAAEKLQQMLSDADGEDRLKSLLENFIGQGNSGTTDAEQPENPDETYRESAAENSTESDGEGENMLQNLLGTLMSSGDGNANSSAKGGLDLSSLLSGMGSQNNSQSGIDLDMIMKIQRIMSALNQQKSDASSDFLRSLKPFLKQERRKKLDSAIKIMSLTKVLKLMNDNGKGGI